jgi:hypothetical protein
MFRRETERVSEVRVPRGLSIRLPLSESSCLQLKRLSALKVAAFENLLVHSPPSSALRLRSSKEIP